MCATLYAGDCGGCDLFTVGVEVLEVPQAMRCVLFCMLEAVGGGLYLLDAMRRAVLYAGGRGG